MNIKIELTEREWFGLMRGGVGSPSKRKQFGTFGLGKKINEQFSSQLPMGEIDKLKSEWNAIKSDLPAITPKKIKPTKIAPKKIEGYIVRE